MRSLIHETLVRLSIPYSRGKAAQKNNNDNDNIRAPWCNRCVGVPKQGALITSEAGEHLHITDIWDCGEPSGFCLRKPAPHVVQALGPRHERSGRVTRSTEPLGHGTVRLHFSASKLVESHCEAYDGNNQWNISLLLCTGQHWPFWKDDHYSNGSACHVRRRFSVIRVVVVLKVDVRQLDWLWKCLTSSSVGKVMIESHMLNLDWAPPPGFCSLVIIKMKYVELFFFFSRTEEVFQMRSQGPQAQTSNQQENAPFNHLRSSGCSAESPSES